jgi:O-methyltransferase involved in polyketide biosynthesis
MEQLVENISDTARWVAIFRAEESERPNAVFHDSFHLE